LNVKTAIRFLKLGQLSKKWKKARYPVPNVIARISREFLMAADSAVVEVLSQPVPALVLLAPLAVVLLAGDRKYKI
jgi:hypothetical protein